MKIAISSTGKDINSNVDSVFGRCPFFIIAEVEDKKIVKTETIRNTSVEKLSGAGISAAQTVVEKGANVIITGNVGPRALSVLKQFNVKVYSGSGSIKEALQNFINDKLKKIDK